MIPRKKAAKKRLVEYDQGKRKIAKTLDHDGNPLYDPEAMVNKIDDYLEFIRKEDPDKIPILKECCLRYGWSYDYFLQMCRDDLGLAHARNKLLDTKEVALERGGLTGKLVSSIAAFSLKQLGWSEKNEITVALNDENSDPLSRAFESLSAPKYDVKNNRKRKDVVS